ncbi:hypothetical protein GALL_492420 [mine drainage metagenome]|uniref:Uncharacterized protein n=1 Tax=mine drainage metagenome TaxID=410659 RepID=A0A1J5PEE8_9ZZZZ
MNPNVAQGTGDARLASVNSPPAQTNAVRTATRTLARWTNRSMKGVVNSMAFDMDRAKPATSSPNLCCTQKIGR